MSVSSIDKTAAFSATTAANIARSENNVAAQKDQFLKLMLAQMKNQDPLNPMDGAEYASQMAQFSTVEGIQNMRDLQQQSNVLIDTMMTLQASDLVNTKVSVPVSELSLKEAESIKGYVDLKTSGEEVDVIVRHEDGSVAQQVSMGSRSPGRLDFDIPELAAGKYSIEVAVKNGDDVRTNTPLLERTIQKVSVPGNGGSLTLELSGVGNVPLYTINEFLGGNA